MTQTVIFHLLTESGGLIPISLGLLEDQTVNHPCRWAPYNVNFVKAENWSVMGTAIALGQWHAVGTQSIFAVRMNAVMLFPSILLPTVNRHILQQFKMSSVPQMPEAQFKALWDFYTHSWEQPLTYSSLWPPPVLSLTVTLHVELQKPKDPLPSKSEIKNRVTYSFFILVSKDISFKSTIVIHLSKKGHFNSKIWWTHYQNRWQSFLRTNSW